MLNNLFGRQELIGFARQQFRDYDSMSVPNAELEAALAEGWTIARKSKKSTRLSRPKKRSDLLESRVWSLFYRMGFPILSGKGGAELVLTPADTSSPTTQLDVVAVDDEVALHVECKSVEEPKKDRRFQDKLAKHAGNRKGFARAISRQYGTEKKRHVGSIMFTWGIVLAENDHKRAAEAGVIVFDEQDLQYFEALVGHLGPAAQYQFLTSVFRGKKITGLEIRVPALKAKMGGYVCYAFSIRPEYLLKIGYISHRAKGKAIDVDAYQRMISKSRLKKVAAYIEEDGVFPTNIVLNIVKRRYVRFDRGKQEGTPAGAVFGWLTLTPAYGSAWVIDGQHRLFAFSGLKRASTGFLHVLAFEELPPSKQAQLFVDINSEQKRVKRALLVELTADLKWDDEDEDERITAIISKVVMALDQELDSPFHERILLADAKRTEKRCISLTSVFSALHKPGLFVVRRAKGIAEYGPLWAGSNDPTLRRTLTIIKEWFAVISDRANDWWELGAGEGGGLAMNDGVTVCANVLRSVFEHLTTEYSEALWHYETDELTEMLLPFANTLGDYLGKKSADEREAFRSLRGVQGQTTATRFCQEALRHAFRKYDPAGLTEWMDTRKANTNEKGRHIIDWIETTMQDTIVSTLREEFTDSVDQWWFEGVPKQVRKKVDERINESDGKSGTREQNFDLIHYREIIKNQWSLFEKLFGYGTGNKDKRTKWIVEVGEMRNTVMHPSRREYLSIPKLQTLENYKEWLEKQLGSVSG